MKSEVTSAKVAAIAGRILECLKEAQPDAWITVGMCEVDVRRGRDADNHIDVCTVAELRALAASALTQAKDRKRK